MAGEKCPIHFVDSSVLSSDTSQIDPMHGSQTGLNGSITRMRFDQQRQDQCVNRGSRLRRTNLASQGFFQRLDSSRRPTIQRLTRDTVCTTQLTDHPMTRVRQHLTDHFHALLNSATMGHVSSLKTVKVCCLFHHIFQGFFSSIFLSFVTLVHARFEPCLKQKIACLPYPLPSQTLLPKTFDTAFPFLHRNKHSTM